MMKRIGLVLAVAIGVAGCGGGGGSTPASVAPAGTATTAATTTPSPGATATAKAAATATPFAMPAPSTIATSAPTAASSTTGLEQIPLALNVNNLSGTFYGEIVATLPSVSPRQMVMLPNGDLLVGTGGGTASFAQSGKIYILPNAEAATPGTPAIFATLTDSSCASSAGTNTNGITFAPGTGGGTIFVGMECSVWKIPYATGDRVASSAGTKFTSVRTGGTAGSGNDQDDHHTTSVLAVGSNLYVSVGSSCNACTETDPTRGSVQETTVTGGVLTTVATRLRNALALAVNPVTQTVWAGGAGQDCVTGSSCFTAQDATYALNGHPYEWMDPLTLSRAAHGTPVDYMWPWCEEYQSAVSAPDGSASTLTAPAGTNCANMVVAPVRAPAYSTIMSAVFYPTPANGATYAFPSMYDNGMFFTLHGSWHENASGIQVAVPEVVFIPMNGDTPVYAENWSSSSPYANWARSGGNPAPFMNGFQQGGTRIGRPAGLAVGASGSLFISDDSAGEIYRIRPGTAPQAIRRAIAPSSTLRR
jgi:glucose/arabinose dehydrogenase